ncbi:MAG: phenylalanine--tRNA ligase subunit beta [Alphaproteobacteria bacterium]
MKFTIGWLKDYLDTDASLDQIVDTLTAVGLEVEEVTDVGADLAAVRTAKVIDAQPHPDADKLRLCKVMAHNDDGSTQEVQVVCGAPNARAGMIAAFAPVGTYLPTIDLTLTKAKIRGVESFGMMCSERELGFGEDHDGIIDLPEGTPLGAPIADIYGKNDPMIEIAITPNRPDCLGVYGIARDLAAAGLGTLKPMTAPVISATIDDKAAIVAPADQGGLSACPVFAGRIVKNVKNGDSPDWLKSRLTAIGLRPISALVDITNYISYSYGRPLHVYDLSKVSGAIGARLAKMGESFTALDEVTYELSDADCVIADEAGVLGLGGIMGGLDSGCTETTIDVLIESAWFDPITIAHSGRAHNILSDARYRFERGVDPQSVVPGLDIATQMILDACGGAAGPMTVAGEVPNHERNLSMPIARINALAGIDVAADETIGILDALGFAPTVDGGTVSVTVPNWRPDVDGTADLVEEVVRIVGLDNLQAVDLPPVSGGAGKATSLLQDRRRWVRRSLANQGLHEAVTYSFMDEAHAKLFDGGNRKVQLVNPISTELGTMRPSILPNLINAAARNVARGQDVIRLFEVGPQYAGDLPDDQQMVAAALRRGTAADRNMHDAARPVDLFDAKADAIAALRDAGAPVDTAQVVADAPSWYHPGRSGTIRLGPKVVLAHFGELHPKILKALDLKGPAVAAEIFIDAIPQPKAKKGKPVSKSKGAVDMAQLLPVHRDFAFELDSTVAADAVLRAAKGADKALITGARVFDLYEGEHMTDGRKSLAITVTLQPRDKTLTDKDIEAVSDKIIAAVAKATGGTLRG